MNVVSLERFRSQNGVRYFYPLDGTPGPLMAAIDFSDPDRFAKLKTVVLGVSMDHRSSHGEFCDRHGLPVQPFAETACEVCDRYGVLREKEYEGSRKNVHSAFHVCD